MTCRRCLLGLLVLLGCPEPRPPEPTAPPAEAIEPGAALRDGAQRAAKDSAPQEPDVAAPRVVDDDHDDDDDRDDDDDDDRDDESDSGPQEVTPEGEESPLSADLDGDGTPETIAWECDERLVVRVGKATVSEPFGVSEMVGCWAGTIALRPGSGSLQLFVEVGEHEEVGPSRHILFQYRHGKLKTIWDASGDVVFLADGSWNSESGDCNDIDLKYTTTTTTMRWDGERVSTRETIEVEPIEADACAEP